MENDRRYINNPDTTREFAELLKKISFVYWDALDTLAFYRSDTISSDREKESFLSEIHDVANELSRFLAKLDRFVGFKINKSSTEKLIKQEIVSVILASESAYENEISRKFKNLVLSARDLCVFLKYLKDSIQKAFDSPLGLADSLYLKLADNLNKGGVMYKGIGFDRDTSLQALSQIYALEIYQSYKKWRISDYLQSKFNEVTKYKNKLLKNAGHVFDDLNKISEMYVEYEIFIEDVLESSAKIHNELLELEKDFNKDSGSNANLLVTLSSLESSLREAEIYLQANAEFIQVTQEDLGKHHLSLIKVKTDSIKFFIKFQEFVENYKQFEKARILEVLRTRTEKLRKDLEKSLLEIIFEAKSYDADVLRCEVANVFNAQFASAINKLYDAYALGNTNITKRILQSIDATLKNYKLLVNDNEKFVKIALQAAQNARLDISWIEYFSENAIAEFRKKLLISKRFTEKIDAQKINFLTVAKGVLKDSENPNALLMTLNDFRQLLAFESKFVLHPNTLLRCVLVVLLASYLNNKEIKTLADELISHPEMKPVLEFLQIHA